LVFARYVVVSVSSFLLDIILFTVFHYASGHIIGSTYAARLLSGFFNFYFNKHAVFRFHEPRHYLQESLGYLALAVIIATLSGAAVDWLTLLTGWHALPIKIIVDTHLFIVSFLVQRFILFRHSESVCRDYP
jgi:putative flippase GtrA